MWRLTLVSSIFLWRKIMKNDWEHVIKKLESWKRLLPWNWFVRLPNGKYVKRSDFLTTIRPLLQLNASRDEDSLMMLEYLASPKSGEPCFSAHLDKICKQVFPNLIKLGLIRLNGQFWFQAQIEPKAQPIVAALVFSPMDPTYWTIQEPR